VGCGPWDTALGGIETPHYFQQSLIVLQVLYKNAPKITSPGPWVACEEICHGFSQLGSPGQSFSGHSGQMAEASYSWDVSTRRCGSTYRAVRFLQLLTIAYSRDRQPTARGPDLACQAKSSGPQPLYKL